MPNHKEMGWDLVEYAWDEDTGEALFLYERTVDGVHEEVTISRRQMRYWIPAALRECDEDTFAGC